MPERVDADDWFTLAELTERLSGLVWVEDQLAALLKHWAGIESVATASVLFHTTAAHHRWHAQVIRDCLPTSPALDAERAIVAPTTGWQDSMALLREWTDPDATALRLKSLVKIIDPWLDREVGALLDLARPISDAPMMRWLRFVSIDHHDDGEATSLLGATRSSVAVRVSDHQLFANLDLR